MRSVMRHSFSQVPNAEIQRSRFNRSCGHKSTFDAGQLIPIFVDEVLPGDTFNLRTQAFGRLATPIFPIMDNMYIDTFYFFVPNRLVWDNWERFMGEQPNPGDSTDFLIPQKPLDTGAAESSLYDHMGIPTNVNNLTVSALPLRAYNLIYNDWFRDQNLQDSLPVPKDDGPDINTGYNIVARGKRHDYFTSCLPFPQKGPSVDLPLGGTAPVDVDSITGTGSPRFQDQTQPLTQGALWVDGTGVGNVAFAQGSGALAGGDLDWVDPMLVGSGTADLSSASAATINQLRQAFQIQKFYERDARGGTRYIEMNKAHFGVTSPDARLQRPEYLGGGSSPINITPIATTADIASVGGERTVGDLGAMGTTSFRNHGFVKSFTEHGHVIGLACVRADLTYQQGLNRMWSREDRLDFYFPVFAHLGEQEVLNKEIYAQGTAADDEVFGYQERYAEYRYKPSCIAGAFRSNAATPLDAWHLSQDFENLPVLGDEFIKERPPLDRVVAVPSEPKFIFDFYHKFDCARPMPMFGVPGNIDRF